MVSLLPTKYLFHPHHHSGLTPQPSLCLVIPVEDPQQLHFGQEMVKLSVVMPHTASHSVQHYIGMMCFRESQYRSRLTVTGRLPEVYQYSVTNRAMSTIEVGSFTIQGNNSYNYMHVQFSIVNQQYNIISRQKSRLMTRHTKFTFTFRCCSSY